MADNAYDTLKALLDQYGIDTPELDTLARNAAVNDMTGDQFMQSLRSTTTYKQRFPAMEARRKAGLPPLSEAEYVSTEGTYRQLMRNAGLPAGFYDQKDDFTNLIATDVSPAELQTRVESGYSAMANAPADVKDQLFNLYGVTPGAMAAYFLDPTRGVDAIQRQVAAANIGAAATRTGFGQLTTGQAEELVGAGLSQSQAQTGFETLGREQELMGALPGENVSTITKGEQLGALEGNLATQQEIERRAAQRKAAFAGGGGYAEGSGGVSGLGHGT